MKVTLEIQKELQTEVLVVGGGTAGVFAAISAARGGARTMLVEKNSMLGGTMTVAGVNFPGLFFAWGKQIIDGPCWEAIEKTIAMGGAQMPKISFKPQKHYHEQIKLNRFVFTGVLFEMCKEAGVEVLTNAMLASVKENENGVDVLISEKTGLSKVHAKVVIDATGDANLVMMAGYPVTKSAKQQPATLQNHISGYDVTQISMKELEEARKTADIPDYVTAKTLMHDFERNKLEVHIPCKNADTSEGRTKVEQDAYETMLKVYRFCRSIKGMENMTIDYTPEETGVRETNRIVGESIVRAEDYIQGVLYPDSICYAFYPIDLHVMDGIEQTFHKENVVSKVPYGALVPKGARRILCAGRCISSDTYANSAVRVEAVCMATGQAAGCAAAIAAKGACEVTKVDYAALSSMLTKIGAIVPK